jgi:hypothetical protein
MVNNNYATDDLHFIAFPYGFKLTTNSLQSILSINATALNATHFTVNISTGLANSLLLVDFSVLAFNRGEIMSNYSVYIDLMLSSVSGTNTTSQAGSLLPTQYIFRNSISGGIHLYFPLTGNPTSANYYYYSVSSPSNNQIVWRTFNNRVINCSGLTYYEPISQLCHNNCPVEYYPNNTNNTINLCLPCHHTCLTCSNSDNNSCLSCNASLTRVLSSTQCICLSGYY